MTVAKGGGHAAGGRLAMSAGHTETTVGMGEGAEDLCTFLDIKMVGKEVLQLGVLGRNGGCVDD